MKKKILLMTVALLCAVVQSTWADEGTWWDEGIRATTFSEQNVKAKTISITSEAELGLLIDSISHYGGKDYEGYTITLTRNLDMSAHKWAGFGTFKGTFDGQEWTISGLNCLDDNPDISDAGLIAHNNGIIKNVQLVNSVIIGKRYVGAIAGENTGTVENCYVGADVKVYASKNYDSSTSCGGIVGIQIKSNETQLKTSGCYSEASINGYKDLGGIIGYFKNGTMENCVSKATISCETTEGTKGMLAGLVVEGATFVNNYYVAEAKEESANGTRLISVKLSDELLADGLLKYYGTIEERYGAKHVMFYSSQIAIDDDWYAIEGNAFTFKLESASDLVQFKYVMVNSNELTTTNSVYTFDTNDEAA